jgi:membrane fusion protein, multidrug efflux system
MKRSIFPAILKQDPRWRVGVLVVGLLMAACTRQEAANLPAPPPPAVSVTVVRKAAIADTLKYVGRTEPVSFVHLRARVAGFLTQLDFEEGSEVRQGDLLYVIEQEPYQAAVEIAEAAVAQTEASLDTAERYLSRLQTVKDTGGISKAVFDSSEGNVVEARAVLKERRARLVQARLNLGYTEIRAPISGQIGKTSVHVGNLVGPESGVLATINRMDPIWVSFPISEREYLLLRERIDQARRGGGRVFPMVPTIRLVDGSNFPHAGRIDFEDNQLDRSTGTIMLRATFPNPHRLLKPGQFVTVIQTASGAADRLLIPQAAVQRDQVGAFVFVVEKETNRADVRRIRLGEESGAEWIVSEGLEEGELVVSEGVQKVTPGGTVRPVAVVPFEEQEE